MSILLLYAGLAVALVYLPMTAAVPSWPRSAIKTTPLLIFCLAAYLAGGSAFLITGLFLSALGDFALSRKGEAAFLYGLSAFALAHLVYILFFLGLSGGALWDAFSLYPILAICLVAMSLTTELWLTPHVASLRWPVRVYVLVITGMGLAALTLPLGLASLGAALFILSDMILALQLFRMGEDNKWVRPVGWAIWFFYIAGQGLILTSGVF